MNNLNFEYLFLNFYESLSKLTHQVFPNFDYYLSVTKVVMIILDILFCAILIYLLSEIDKIRSWEKSYWETPIVDEPEHGDLNPERARWEQILLRSLSANAADWKVAIIEADTMLDQAVALNFPNGDNLGERLKSITDRDLRTLDDAWEAHKVRNIIAHEAGYQLTQHETRRILRLYQNVLEELGTLVSSRVDIPIKIEYN
ncbi:MAG: hypothetical protein WCO03_01530 [bacterium]